MDIRDFPGECRDAKGRINNDGEIMKCKMNEIDVGVMPDGTVIVEDHQQDVEWTGDIEDLSRSFASLNLDDPTYQGTISIARDGLIQI